MLRILAGIFSLVAVSASAMTLANLTIGSNLIGNIAHLKDFPVIELRRYKIKEGEREHFAQYFDTYFPEALEQVGTIVFGDFFERKDPAGFTWIRGFHSMDDRAIGNAIFYNGPVWKEHKATMNGLLTDSDNVLLLRPLTPELGITIFPADDPVTERSAARGVVVAQIFPIKANSLDAFVQQAETTFAGYRAAGAREAGVLVTLDVPNNYPQLPIRTDGPYLVWLGIVKDDQMLETGFTPVAERAQHALTATGLLRSAPEFLILDPTSRSRLRWLP